MQHFLPSALPKRSRPISGTALSFLGTIGFFQGSGTFYSGAFSLLDNQTFAARPYMAARMAARMAVCMEARA